MRAAELRPSPSDRHRSDYKALQATAKALGRTLLLGRRADDGRIYYVVSHQAQAYHFTHLHDVLGHLNALEGAS
jgi:hypothetical protein